MQTLKIASRTVTEDVELCKEIIKLNKDTIISLGMFDYEKNKLPFKEKILSILLYIKISN